MIEQEQKEITPLLGTDMEGNPVLNDSEGAPVRSSTFEVLMNTNVSDVRWVAWDTETTGISAQKDHVVEIAALAFDEEFEHRRFHNLVKPPILISEQVQKIHGISNEMVADSPEFSQVWASFQEFLGFSGSPRVLIAHNASFDLGMVTRRGKSVWLKEEVVLDTCGLAKALLPELRHHKLSVLADHFKYQVPEGEHLHRAGADVGALKHVFLGLLALAADRFTSTTAGGLTLGHLVEHAGGFFRAHQSIDFEFSPRIAALKRLCETQQAVRITYNTEDDVRWVTPQSIVMDRFKIYLNALCHRDQIVKKFRTDRILHMILPT